MIFMSIPGASFKPEKIKNVDVVYFEDGTFYQKIDEEWIITSPLNIVNLEIAKNTETKWGLRSTSMPGSFPALGTPYELVELPWNAKIAGSEDENKQ